MSATVPRPLPSPVLDRAVAGRGLGSQTTVRSLLDGGDRPVVLVFLRHYG